jgi:hypothetical protein
MAYQFIVKQSEKISLTSDRVISDGDNISILLDELTKLKKGLVDPSLALVQALKKLLSGVVSEAEVGIYLVEPYQRVYPICWYVYLQIE